MLIIDERVQNILREAEDKIRDIAKDDSISVLVFSKKIELKLSFDDIVDIVCDVTGQLKRDVIKPSRKRELVTARQLIVYFSFHYCSLSKSEIARNLDQDHTTALSSLKKVNDLLASGDRILCAYVNELNGIIQGLKLNQHDRPPTTRTSDGNSIANQGSAEHLL